MINYYWREVMGNWDKIYAVQRMQNYIKAHVNEFIQLEDIVKGSGYSKRHAMRIFRELLGKTPLEYVRAIRLTESAKVLLKKSENVLDTALDFGYDTHEGFTRAFSNEFGLTPKKYQQEKPPIKYFIQYPVSHYYSYLNNKENDNMKQEKETKICTVTIIKRPKRKLMLMRAKKAVDYWSFCEEKGCDWEGLFNSIDCKMDNAAIMKLPENLIVAGTTYCVAGIEIPHDYSGKVIDDCEIIDLEECDMMFFQSETFENDSDFGTAIDEVNKAIRTYNPKQYGYRFALDLAPRFNYGASKEIGAKQAIPVQKI